MNFNQVDQILPVEVLRMNLLHHFAQPLSEAPHVRDFLVLPRREH